MDDKVNTFMFGKCMVVVVTFLLRLALNIFHLLYIFCSYHKKLTAGVSFVGILSALK